MLILKKDMEVVNLRAWVIVFLVLFISNCAAECSKNQININSASARKLAKIAYVGEVRSEEIIKLRPFESIDELIEVYGIGEKTLEKIKDQGLACVEEEIIREDREIEKQNPEIIPEEQTITLASQTIKTPESSESSSKTNKWALYLFIGFCILLGVLFLIRKVNLNGLLKKEENEFR